MRALFRFPSLHVRAPLPLLHGIFSSKGETRSVSCASFAVEQAAQVESSLHRAAWTDAFIFPDRFLAHSSCTKESAGQFVAVVGRTSLITYAVVVVCFGIRDFHASVTALLLRHTFICHSRAYDGVLTVRDRCPQSALSTPQALIPMRRQPNASNLLTDTPSNQLDCTLGRGRLKESEDDAPICCTA